MDILGLILWPIKWVIELILVAFHSMWTFIGLDPDAGVTWVLSIVGLVLVVRAALIPIFVRQIKSQRRMLEVAPQLKKIQDKYKGKKDQFSREAMSRETMELYKKTGTNPLSARACRCCCRCRSSSACSRCSTTHDVTARPASACSAGARRLSSANSRAPRHRAAAARRFIEALDERRSDVVMVIAAVMVVLMTASQFITQLQIMSKNSRPR